jgi:NADH:ubiquinone oxidoreductase subunit C
MSKVNLDELSALINASVPGAGSVVTKSEDAKCDSSLNVEASKIFGVIEFLKRNTQISFNSLHCISGVDYLDYFEVCYMLTNYDPSNVREIILKIKMCAGL